MNRIMLVFLPFTAMIMATFMYTTDINQNSTINFQSGNVTVNEQTGNYNVSSITLSTILLITLLIAVAVAVCFVVGIKVFGSGISGSVIPIVFATTILTGVYATLSVISLPVFLSIPVFGIPIFFFLIVMYIVGLTGVAVPSGGD